VYLPIGRLSNGSKAFGDACKKRQEVAKSEQRARGLFCHTAAMTTKTIPAYLEDERRKSGDAQLRMDEQAARILSLHPGHHRTAKHPPLEMPSSVEGANKLRKTAAVAKKPRSSRNTAPKTRKRA